MTALVTANDLFRRVNHVIPSIEWATMAEDVDGDPVLLATSGSAFNYIKEKWPKIRFTDIKETQARPAEG